MENKNNKSELRKDIVSGEWVVVAPGRSARPKDFVEKTKRKRTSKKNCPFENPQKTGHEKPILFYPADNNIDNWRIQVVPNKYPAFTHSNKCAEKIGKGPYEVMEGVGHHDLLITRDHDNSFPDLSEEDAEAVFDMFQKHYENLSKDKCVKYISVFHNWGAKAGASVYHPHYQIMSIPVLPPDIHRSLIGSRKYYEKNNKCVHCKILDWERNRKERIIYENDEAVAFTPFISREPFEVRIFPKKHFPNFGEEEQKTLKGVARILRRVLKSLKNNLNDPDYNFFIHSVPVGGSEEFHHYHWHLEIVPKFSISAGFEIGTGIEVTVVDPDEAAELLTSNEMGNSD